MAEKEPYRLEAVLTLRQRAEDEAKEELARKLRALRAEEKELQNRKDALAAHQRKRAEWIREQTQSMGKGGAAQEIQRMNRYGERLRDEEQRIADRIPPQEEKVEEAKAAVEVARLALVEAQKQKKAIETHKEDWIRQKKKDREAREELQMDEIGQTIHTRGKQGH
jgi:flagellar export protein FliJ